jgi:hypothetical protein
MLYLLNVAADPLCGAVSFGLTAFYELHHLEMQIASGTF